ncbi:limb development membrane protein 1 [Phyllostomus discolor]|uniref:Limb development membrane protein 1 n=1 Tax=Phyllostomus discolor TaxID=89673 RepID=A0A833Z4V3_9CHIR|nr:limb development membrane protein 1 [Phyllostomus discolor]
MPFAFFFLESEGFAGLKKVSARTGAPRCLPQALGHGHGSRTELLNVKTSGAPTVARRLGRAARPGVPDAAAHWEHLCLESA